MGGEGAQSAQFFAVDEGSDSACRQVRSTLALGPKSQMQREDGEDLPLSPEAAYLHLQSTRHHGLHLTMWMGYGHLYFGGLSRQGEARLPKEGLCLAVLAPPAWVPYR